MTAWRAIWMGVALVTLAAGAAPGVGAAGAVKGAVVFKGPVPEARKLPVTIDQYVCGKEKTAEELLVSPQGGIRRTWWLGSRPADEYLDVSVGIANGYATIGAIGFEGRRDYAAIGSVTNLASRLCADASPDQILISECVHAAVADLVDAKEIGPLQLKGFHRPVLAYNVIQVKPGS